MVSGVLPFRIKSLHDEYGSIVRVAPDELSFIDSRAWKDIYMNKAFIRPKVWGSRPPGVEAHNLISASVEDHARFRKALQPAFSDKATREHESTVQSYIDLLISRFNEAIAKNRGEAATVDLVQWLNFTTFDIIGDLGWGAAFGCLKDTTYHPWIKVVLHFKAVLLATSLKYYPVLEAIIMAITPKSAMADLQQVLVTTHNKVKDRLAREEPEYSDIISHIISHNASSPDTALTPGEIEANSMAIIVAGSETLTTALAGAIHYLLQNPDVFKTLLAENHATFPSEKNITASSTAALPYLTAVISETLRMCPPLPDGLRREVPKGGAIIAGHSIPEGITVSIPCWAMFQSSSNFTDPEVFAPERWLNNSNSTSNYEKDDKAAFQPFSMGPHGCIGKGLAWMEMRLVLSRILWNFGIEGGVRDGVERWEEQRVYWTWEKRPMEVKLMKARQVPD
jgi:cytochrome P450